MSIKSPTTYADWYWSKNVEASQAFDESMEVAYAPYFSSLMGDIPELELLPSSVQNLLGAFASPEHAGMSGFALGVGVEMVDELIRGAMEPVMKIMRRKINAAARETWLTSEQANTLFHRNKIQEELWEGTLASEGYEDILGGFLYKAQLPYPTIPDLILYSRYHGDPDDVWSTLQDFCKIDPVDYKLWDWLGKQRLTTQQVHTLHRRGILFEGDLLNELKQIGWTDETARLVGETLWLIPNAMLMVQGDLHRGIERDTIITDISRADVHPEFAETYLDAVLTKPSSQDVINYQLRQDPTLSDLGSHLTRIGIHPDYTELYRTLAYQIPPVVDIITMAVREAFTPAIAERFGQYEDFPEDFSYWAKRKGLTEEWAKRYWAAHWSLPSPLQGFEMLHRGVINEEELNVLLRALDVMPFWRDKLTKIAYRRLTRVDVRRMYKEGVLDEEGVLEAYLEHGYNERDAKRMTDFTVRQTLSSLSRFTTKDIVNAYVKRMISRIEAKSLLGTLRVRGDDAEFILSTADYRREWDLTESKISGIRNLYRKGVYDEDKARDALGRLDLPAEQVSVLMEQWYYEAKEVAPRTWTTAQTLGFIKDKIITESRGRLELNRMGYDTEHIEAYMKAIQ
jgi:hypothetical protein